MSNLIDDIGILVSTDPVAIDKASFDLVQKNGKQFKGKAIFGYAEKMGLGSAEYTLVEV